MARSTRQRAAVRSVFQDLDGFHSAQEVHARLRAAGDPVGLSTVYRAVQSLADDGEHDFADVSHTLEIFGTCADCRAGGISAPAPAAQTAP
jgi:Fur family ferric uptake transcriptional regulator